ncbi:hypothetical protein GDO86_002883 [Hymenochirus boettgeri]|uniref:Spermatogenesis associated 22 n=1 Tax=Hymenochirus boettgeri TaxID=247094 RepID=A0A8T2K3N5_9PIPI|nr:hypothetical protein GDO86_002883 [Hymenochirus boettgeri]
MKHQNQYSRRDNGPYGKPLSNESLKEQKGHKLYHFQVQSHKKLTESIPTSTPKRLSCNSLPGTKNPRTSCTVINQNKTKDNAFADMPEDEMVQKVPANHMTFKETNNSLRIIPASIESMKYWSQFTDKIGLLYEVLAMLDSAVISGDYGSKTFLLRDGKNNVHCVFHEIDRDLPRLIRGQVHRAMGNYDRRKNLFRCFSVRPASVAEQNTFHEFIAVANVEMENYVSTVNEI